jgi:hypothetical protein
MSRATLYRRLREPTVAIRPRAGGVPEQECDLALANPVCVP